MAKKQKVDKIYKETREQHRQRVSNDGGQFRSRIETPKTVYNRKRQKHNSLRDMQKGGW